MANRKPRRFQSGGVTADDLEIANASEDPIAALNARKGWTDSEEVVSEPKEKNLPQKTIAKSAPVVTKKQLEESGLSLRDYLNRELGLTRRKDGPSPSAKPSAVSKASQEKVTDTGDDVGRLLARAPAKTSSAAPKKPTYETPYDRMNRQNREAEAMRRSAADDERASLRKNIREGNSGKVNSKTLLPESGMKKGGSVKGWGMARGARKAKIV